MDYNDLYEVLVSFLQEFRQQIKQERDLIMQQVSMIATSNHQDIALATPEYNTGDDMLNEAAKSLLNKLIEISDNKYEHPKKHDASMITTNPGRRFVTDKQIVEFSNKVDKDYVDFKIEQLRRDMLVEISNKLDNIINMPNVTSNLNSINALLNSDETMLNMIKTCEGKLDAEALEEHEKSRHLTDEDVINLKILANFVEHGGVDWNADPDQGMLGIMNKPSSMPADGGDSTTVSGLSKDNIISGRFPELVIGKGNTVTICDFICDGTAESVHRCLQEAIDRLPEEGGVIRLLPGVYELDGISCGNTIAYIKGCPGVTINLTGELDLGRYTTIRDVTIKGKSKDSIISMNGSDSIRSCKIENCLIQIYSSLNQIQLSNVYNSTISFCKDAISNFISFNTFSAVTTPLFVGENCIDTNYTMK